MPFPPAGCSCLFFLSTSVDHPGREFKSLGRTDRDDIVAVNLGCTFKCESGSVLLTFRNRTAWQANLGEHGRIVTKRLVHVRDHLHNLAEQRALAVIHYFGDEIGAD